MVVATAIEVKDLDKSLLDDLLNDIDFAYRFCKKEGDTVLSVVQDKHEELQQKALDFYSEFGITEVALDDEDLAKIYEQKIM